MDNLINKLRQDSYKVQNQNKRYDISYPIFIKYFKKKESLSNEDIIIGIHFTYGWMPTIFSFKSDKLEEVVRNLNEFRIGKDIFNSNKELELLKGLFNNSIVGTSKLLHFINPHTAPIWDSRVHNYLYDHYDITKEVNSVKNYRSYKILLDQIILKENEFRSIRENTIKRLKLANETSNYRVLEQLMFHTELEKLYTRIY